MLRPGDVAQPMITPSSAPCVCLCHGVLGNAEILLLGTELVPSPAERWHEVGMRAARGIARREPELLRPEASEADLPGLMLGLSGVAAFFLRPERGPSVLLPG